MIMMQMGEKKQQQQQPKQLNNFSLRSFVRASANAPDCVRSRLILLKSNGETVPANSALLLVLISGRRAITSHQYSGAATAAVETRWPAKFCKYVWSLWHEIYFNVSLFFHRFVLFLCRYFSCVHTDSSADFYWFCRCGALFTQEI